MIEDQDYNMDQFSDAEEKEPSYPIDIENPPNINFNSDVLPIAEESSGSSKGEEKSEDK